MSRLLSILSIACVLAGCAAISDQWDLGAFAQETTFRRILAQAELGDAESQNAAGYMLFHGEGVPADRAQAQLWFERAALQGNKRARRNLAYMAAYPAPLTPAAATAAEFPTGAQRQYMVFCGGCHGLRGIAAYENSPSFAFGERLEKPDAVLMRSVLNGRQEMPAWDGKLPAAELRAILAYVRTLPARYDEGLAGAATPLPRYIYFFGPMEQRARGAAR